MSADEYQEVHFIATGKNKKKRTQGIASTVRTACGQDGEELIEFWLSVVTDPARKDADRIRCSELLADRGWGKAASFVPQEGDPLGLEDVELAAEEFRGKLLRLAAANGADGEAPGSRAS